MGGKQHEPSSDTDVPQYVYKTVMCLYNSFQNCAWACTHKHIALILIWGYGENIFYFTGVRAKQASFLEDLDL